MLELFSMSVMRHSDIAIRLDGYIQYSNSGLARISADTLTSLRRFGLPVKPNPLFPSSVSGLVGQGQLPQ